MSRKKHPGPETCWSTTEGPCAAWNGHPFHGCCREEGHGRGESKRSLGRSHVCICGKSWR